MIREDSPSSSVADLTLLGKLFEKHRSKMVAMARRRIASARASRIDAEAVVNERFLVARQVTEPRGRLTWQDACNHWRITKADGTD